MWLRIRSNTLYGAAFGAAWFVIYDKIFCPHGNVTSNKFLAAHAVGGAVFTMTFYHPSSILYGALLGLSIAAGRQYTEAKIYPANFRVELPMVPE